MEKPLQTHLFSIMYFCGLNSFSLVQLRMIIVLNEGLWAGSMESSDGATLTVRLPLDDKKTLQVSPLYFDTNNARLH